MINKALALVVAIICISLPPNAEPPANDTDLQIYRKVIAVARTGSFDGLALADPVMLLRNTRPERFGRMRTTELPPNYREAYDKLRLRTDSVNLGALAGDGLALSETLDKSWHHCNALFSQIGYNSTGDAAAVLFTYGCRRDTLDFRRSYMVFLSQTSGEWKITNYVDTHEKQGDAIGKLMEHFYYEPWEVPREAYPAAAEHLYSDDMLERIFGRSDTTLAQRDRLSLGIPWGVYSMTDSCFELFAAQLDPDPDQYAEGKRRLIFPILLDGGDYGVFLVNAHIYKGYFARGIAVGHTRSVDAPRMRRRPDVKELLGEVNVGRDRRYWAWRDNKGKFRLSEIANFAWTASRADYVLIGTLKNKRSRAVTVIHAADSLRGREESIKYYDAGDLDVEKVLKGPHSTTRETVCFASDRPSEDASKSGYHPVLVENGDKRIWILERLPDAFSPPFWLASEGRYVLEMEHLDAVLEYLPDPPPRMMDCPMTRGKKWNADLTGEKGQTVFFILGMLDEYVCRHFVEDGDLVERFYCNEHGVADVFHKYLERLNDEQRLGASIKKIIKQECLPLYHSPTLSAFINSFYDYKLTTSSVMEGDDGWKMTGNACLTVDVFDGLERDTKLAYLAGAYYRWGEGDSFRFANSSWKADLIKELLTEFGCTAERSWREGIPATNWVYFKPTKELKSWFDRLPENN